MQTNALSHVVTAQRFAYLPILAFLRQTQPVFRIDGNEQFNPMDIEIAFKKYLKRLAGIVMLAQCHFATTAWAANYRYIALDAPNATQGTLAYGINDHAQIVGVYYDEQGAHGFLYHDGQYATLDAPDAKFGTYAYAINDSAQIVGNYLSDSGKHGFVYINDVYTTLDNPYGGETNITGINNNGRIVGNYRLGSTGIYGFLYDSRQNVFTTINNPLASAGNTSAMGINDRDEIVGFYYNSGAHGFSYDGTEFVTLDAPNAAPAGSFGYGINNAGQIAGVYYDTKSAKGFVYERGRYETLSAANVKTIFANGINESGQIVGHYTDNNGSHGFLAAPEAEPILEFVNLQSAYQTGETISITLQEPDGVRQQAFDLWVAILTPGQELLYISPENPNSIGTSANPFKRSVNTGENRHPIINIPAPRNAMGRYTLFAVFSHPGSAIDHLSETLRSNIAKAEIQIQ